MREWIARIIDWFRRSRLDGELKEELRFHRTQLEREAWERGDADPRAAASRRLGSEAAAREAAWERASIPWLDRLQQDVRHAVRGLRRAPGFMVAVILTLGLGIGANVAMFDVVDRLMFRPLEWLRDSSRVHRIYWQWKDRGSEVTAGSTYYRRYLDLAESTTSFETLAAFAELNLAIGEGEDARVRRVGVVSASYFDFFDARPVVGRFFSKDEDVTPRGADVVVLSWASWQQDFGGRDVLGELVRVGDVPATIIGVAPRGFNGVNDASPPAAWLPITTYAASTGTGDAKTYFRDYSWGWVNVLVRRAPGVSIARANADATRAFARSWQSASASEPNLVALEEASPRALVSAVRPGAGPSPGLEARTARWIAAVAAVVFLLACANVSNLVLSHALRRRTEVTIRLALGAGRRRLVAQSLTSSLVLALLGGMTALVVARLSVNAIRRLLITTDVSVNLFETGRTIGITLALSIVAGVLIGVMPAFAAGLFAPDRSLREGARGGTDTRGRLRAALLVVQGAFSVLLLVGAGLFVRSLNAVRAIPMGYDAERVLLANRVFRDATFDDSVQKALRSVLLSAAQSLPDVESAAWVSSAPFVSTSSTTLFVEGVDSVPLLGEFTFQATTPDYFRTMGTAIVRGRGLQDRDGAGAPPVAVVSESMADVLWPGRDAIGQCFRMRERTAPCMTVVGIAQDMIQGDLTGGNRYHYYVSIEQYTRTWGNGLVLRLRDDPVRASERVRAALQEAIPGASYITTRPLRDIVEREQRSWRLGASMFTAFAALAFVVSGVGLYGVIGYNVSVRLHELAIRMALGARQADIVGMVVRQSISIMVLGTSAGLLLALLSSRWIQPLLYRQSARDPVVYAVVAAALVLLALVAGAIPARRASRADPRAALRAE
jgi:putative ABC transport system permease protein